MKPKILVKFFTENSNQIKESLKQNLETFYNCPVEIESLEWDISSAYNQGRRQYLSSRLLSALSQFNHVPGERCLGVFDVDLYSPGNRYIYGDTDISTGVAVISLYHLMPNPNRISAPHTFQLEKAIKIAVFQMGHVFYLNRCSDVNCVMSSSDTTINHDMNKPNLCPNCRNKLNGVT